MKKYLVSILLSIVIALTANIVYGTNENLKDVKYYNNLIKNENIVTILLNKNTKTRKTTKKEVWTGAKNQNTKGGVDVFWKNIIIIFWWLSLFSLW